MVTLESFWIPEACGQTVLPDRSLGQKLMENAKIEMRHFWVIFKQCESTQNFFYLQLWTNFAYKESLAQG